MEITLDLRTEETVRIYFERAQQPIIKSVLPQKAKSVEEALSDYRDSLLPSATSYGRIIRADGTYIGDIWCYCISKETEPNAMLSYCIIDTDYWNRGIASEAVSMFLKEIVDRYDVRTIGAFTFSDNFASIRTLEKNGFLLVESFREDGRASKYFRWDRSE